VNLANNMVVLTSRASGLGQVLAKRFLQAGSNVTICGQWAGYQTAFTPVKRPLTLNLRSGVELQGLVAALAHLGG